MQLMNPDLLGMTGLSGFRTGMADERSMMESDRSLRNSDLINQEREMKNEDFAAGGPLRARERALKLAEAEMLQKEYDSGIIEADRSRKRAMEGADLERKLTDNQLQQLKTRISGTEALSTLFGNEPNPVSMAANWDQAREVGKQYQLDIGEFNQQNAAKLTAMMKATPQAQKLLMDNINQRQALELKDREGKNWLDRIDATGRNQRANTELIQAGQTERTRITAAAREAASGSGAPKSMTQQEAKAWDKLIKFEQGEGPAPTEAEMILLETRTVAKEVKEILSDNPMLTVLQMQASQPGPKQAEAQAALQSEIAKARALSPTAQRLKAIKEKGSSGKPAEKTVKRRGKKPDGREVIEYDDGTVYIEPKKAGQ